jgi:hypothetical protein
MIYYIYVIDTKDFFFYLGFMAKRHTDMALVKSSDHMACWLDCRPFYHISMCTSCMSHLMLK